MTAPDPRLQIAAEVAKADDALRAAEALLGLALYDDAVGRFYYAAFHYACAALLSEGVEATSHHGVQTLVSQHLVKTGRLDAAAARELRRLHAFRQAADYDRHFRFDAVGASEEAEVARRFVDRVRGLLAAGGWTQ